MKKLVLILLVLGLVAALFSGCTALKVLKEEAVKDKEESLTDNTEKQGTKKEEEEADKKQQETAPKENASGSADIKWDSGRFVGRIDNNFVEIKISGVPDKAAAKSFMLDNKIKESFESYGLKSGDNIKIAYIFNKNNQPVIVRIEKLK